MYCPSCGNEIPAGLNYCNRCGANLSFTQQAITTVVNPPVRLIVPSIFLFLTIVGGLGVVFGAATEFARQGLHPAAIVWMVLFSTATLLGCVGLFIRFMTKMMMMQRGIDAPQPVRQPSIEQRPNMQQHLPPPRFEPVASVTENTTRTFAPIYTEPADRGTQ
jgi:zinc ribbon protein